MSTKKHKTLFSKKKKTDYYGDESEPQYTEEQKKRIASYLKDNDENCKESTTLILIIVIGLLVALSIVGFLAIRNNSSVKFKGAHTTSEHSSNATIMDMVWSKWTWLQNLYLGIDNGTNATVDTIEMSAIVALEEELNDFQPIYRHPLLQQLYKYDQSDSTCLQLLSDDNIYSYLTIKHGSWIPSEQYLTEAVDFSWADFVSIEEKEEIELVQTVNSKDLTDKDIKKQKKLQKQIEKDRKQRLKDWKKWGKGPKGKDKDKNGKNKGKNNRRLLGQFGNIKNKMFDPLRAMPNPANIIAPHNKGDEGAGDIEAEMQKKFNGINAGKGGTPFKGKMPGWLQKGGIFPNRDFAKDMRDRLSFGAKKHLKHLDDIKRGNLGKGVLRSPRDILKGLDLSRFGMKPINSDTSDDEKEKDLRELEQKESKRHPYMTLLTNPGQMNDIKCINNDYRRHEFMFKKFDKNDADSTVNNGVDESGKKSVFSYDSNVLMWYCYLVTVQQEAMENMSGAFKVNLTFSDVDMETGFDYIQIYINSMLIDTVSGIGLNWEESNPRMPSFVYYIDADYVSRNGESMEVCMKVVTDSNIIRTGFSSLLRVDYDDPMVTKWSEWSECETKTPVRDYKGAKNSRHWNGDCGIGIRSKNVTECVNTNKSDVAQCHMGERVTQYCVKSNCFDSAMVTDAEHPNRAFLFNGHGRVDPDFADPFLVQRSTQDSFNISDIISELSRVRAEIVSRYPDERVLGTAVINHYFMDQSKLRLGIRLARSLLLGDTFTVYMTGSSNTAGHENMFMSTWPMQLQSIMRPIWKRIGYKGAAFVVKDHAEGGGLGTMQLGPCIPSLIGDDADVVYWESQMNDHGDSVQHSEENHFRNVITLPRRPLYHVMHAGKNGPNHEGKWDEQYGSDNGNEDKSDNDKKEQFKNEQSCYGWVCGKNKKKGDDAWDYTDGLLMDEYTNYGSGIVNFYPANGLAGVNKTKFEEFKTGYLYISWHPGPPGHRVYAEMLAYFYLTSVLETFTDIRDLIDDLTPKNEYITKPIEEMLEILEDPPRSKQMPTKTAGQCDPFCLNATESVCISGYKTLGKPRYSLQRWREMDSSDNDPWTWKTWMHNPDALLYKEGGQGSNDVKLEWESNNGNGALKFVFEAKQYGYIAIEGDNIKDVINAKKGGEIKIFEIDQSNGERKTAEFGFKQNGQALQCIEVGKNEKNKWMLQANGCNIGGLQPYQKYQIVITANSAKIGVKNIRIF